MTPQLPDHWLRMMLLVLSPCCCASLSPLSLLASSLVSASKYSVLLTWHGCVKWEQCQFFSQPFLYVHVPAPCILHTHAPVPVICHLHARGASRLQVPALPGDGLHLLPALPLLPDQSEASIVTSCPPIRAHLATASSSSTGGSTLNQRGSTRLGMRLGNTALWTDKNILGDNMYGWNNSWYLKWD